MSDVTLEEAKITERELDGYFTRLALEEGRLNRPAGSGEKGCRLLRCLRSALLEWERLEKRVESISKDVGDKCGDCSLPNRPVYHKSNELCPSRDEYYG
jgi:hypothetical protein